MMNSMVPREAMSTLKQEPTAPYEDFELTPHYEIDRLVLLVREPAWVYAYWDISSTTRSSVLESIPAQETDPKPCLRFFRLGDDQHYAYFDVEITPFADSWHVYVGDEYMKLSAAIGYKTAAGRFYQIIGSAPIEKYGVIDQDEDVMTIADLYPKSIENSSSSPQMWMKENTMTLREHQWIQSRARQMGTPLLDLEVKTGIILYGRTHPDAVLTINGIRVPIDADGNFSVRYALDDTTLVIPVQAALPEKERQITVTPVITKNVYRTESPRTGNHK